jgi:hypothetical protein
VRSRTENRPSLGCESPDANAVEFVAHAL